MTTQLDYFTNYEAQSTQTFSNKNNQTKTNYFFFSNFLTVMGSITSFVIPPNQSILSNEHDHESHEHSRINTMSLNKSNDIENNSVISLSQTFGVYAQYHCSGINTREIDQFDTSEIISAIEEELHEHGTSIISEVYNQYYYYLDELSSASID